MPFVPKIAIFIFGFSVLAVSMEDDHLNPMNPNHYPNHDFFSPFTDFLNEDKDFMNVSPRVGDTINPDINNPLYEEDQTSPYPLDTTIIPLSDSLVWEEYMIMLSTLQKKEEGHSESKKRSADTVKQEPMLLYGTALPQLDLQSSSSSSSSSLVLSFSKLKAKNPPSDHEKGKRKPRTAVRVSSPTKKDLAGLSEEQLSIYNQVEFKMETGELELGTLDRNQWFVLAYLKGISDEDLNAYLCLSKKTFKDYKSRLRKVGLLS